MSPPQIKKWQKPIKLYKISSTPSGKSVSKHFVKDCLRKQKPQHPLFNSVQTLWNPFTNFSTPKTIYAVKIDIQSNWDVASSYIWHFSKSVALYFLFEYRFGINTRWDPKGAVFMTLFYVFLQKPEDFWIFHAFLKNSNLKEIFQTTPHKKVEMRKWVKKMS